MKKNDMLRKFFDRYDIFTLDSIGILYTASKKKQPIELTSIYKNKFNENKDELEGMNEYTYDTMLSNFNLDKVMESLPDLTDEELSYITNLISSTIYSIESTQKEASIIQKLNDYIKPYIKEFKNRSIFVRENISLSDIKSLFSKYNHFEIDAFNIIFQYIKQDNILEIKNVKNEARQLAAYERRYDNKDYKKATIEDLIKKTKELNNRQLETLYTFIAEAVMNINIYINCLYGTDEKYDNTDPIVIQYQELIKFLTNIEEEKESRRQIDKYKVK